MTAKFLRGFIDGSLSTLGVVIGASSGSATLVVAAAVGGTLANGFSNALSAFSAARTEEYAALRETERAMVAHDLSGTELEGYVRKRSMMAGIADAGGTVLGGALPIWPYVAFSSPSALWVSIGMVAGATAIVGVYTGRVARSNIVLSAAKMVVFAGVMAAAVYGVQRLIVPR